jgi:GNAT superfamily N-acetyltransferase
MPIPRAKPARPERRRATLPAVSLPVIRAPRIDELERCRDIERAAGVLFAEIGFAAVAADEPASAEVLADYVRDQRAWVITNAADEPVGYAVADIVDGRAHLEQLSVLPDQGRRGLGSALLEHVCTWARNDQREAVTLTTFIDVPWNAPFYARHGFRIMDEAEIGPELRDLRAHEAAHGLDPAQRVCMYRALE